MLVPLGGWGRLWSVVPPEPLCMLALLVDLRWSETREVFYLNSSVFSIHPYPMTTTLALCCQLVEPSLTKEEFDVERGWYSGANHDCIDEGGVEQGGAILSEIVVHERAASATLSDIVVHESPIVKAVVTVPFTIHHPTAAPASSLKLRATPFDILCDDAILSVMARVMAATDTKVHVPGLAMRRAHARAVLDMGSVLCTCRRFREVMATAPPLQIEMDRRRTVIRGMLQPPPRRRKGPSTDNHQVDLASRYAVAHVVVAQRV